MPGENMKRLLFVYLCIVMGSANAASIIQPIGVTTNGGTDVFDVVNLINQSGLSTGYSSGITDFDSFVSTTTGIGGIGGAGSAPPVNFDFDLGGIIHVDAIALWGQGSGSASLVEFDLFASNVQDFSTSSLLGNFTIPNLSATLANVFSFAAIDAQYFRVAATRNNGFSSATRFDEFAVRGTAAAVPTPAAVWLLGAGLIGIIGIKKKVSKIPTA
jgi:hypothetical protein